MKQADSLPAHESTALCLQTQPQTPENKGQSYSLSAAELLPGLMVAHRLLLQGARLQVRGIDVLGAVRQEKRSRFMTPEPQTDLS